jgi:hypothetical protein
MIALSIEAAKDKAAQEFGFDSMLDVAVHERIYEEGILSEAITRAMELHTASHLKAKMEEIEQAVNENHSEFVSVYGKEAEDSAYSEGKLIGSEWMRNQIITILNK